MKKLDNKREGIKEKKKVGKSSKFFKKPLVEKVLGITVVTGLLALVPISICVKCEELKDRKVNKAHLLEKPEVPRNEKVTELKNVIEAAGIHGYSSQHIVSKGNNMTDAGLDLVIDLSNLLKNLGMSGDDILNALIQIEDPCMYGGVPHPPGFEVKKDPNWSESIKLTRLLNTIALHQGHMYVWQEGKDSRDYIYGYKYDKSNKTLYITARF